MTIDNLKLLTKNQETIRRLYNQSGFRECKPQNKNYVAISINKLMRLEFRKTIKRGKLIGFHWLEIIICPHYHYNKYKHNGNDFKSSDCINTISEILKYLGFIKTEYTELKVVNIEFGINLVPLVESRDVISGIWFYSKRHFLNPSNETMQYFKKSSESKYKSIKVYCKGIQCHSKLNSPEVNINTFRFEIKSKESKKIKSYGIITVNDLFNLEIYKRLGKELLKEWNKILLVNLNFKSQNIKEKNFIEQTKDILFWDNLVVDVNPNKFDRYKKKYYKTLIGNDNLHNLLRLQMIEKLKYLEN